MNASRSLCLLAAMTTAALVNAFRIPVEAGELSYRIVDTYPHDETAFTQGLAFDNGVLFEGTGLYGQSSLRRVDLETGQVLQSRSLDARFFGEGITIMGDRIIQLTWRENVGFVYDKNTFELLDEFQYPTEGWGITHDGNQLIVSNGSAELDFLNPLTFEKSHSVVVHDADGPITRLNELEYIDGLIYANVWLTDEIVLIDPQTGFVVDWLDMTGLLDPRAARNANVLNGIAYDAANDRLLVTGKLWPRIFQVRIVPESTSGLLQAGDADQDLDFDQLDLVKVQIAGKYLTGQAATWGDGDWNGAPGGEPGNPPVGDGIFDQSDIIAAQQAAAYLTGPYAAAEPDWQSGDIFKATFGGSFGSVSFGNAAQAALPKDFLLSDLSVVGSLADGGDLDESVLAYVPEPASALLLALGLVIGLIHFRRSNG